MVNRRKSLLPAGITAFYGDFESGDVVDLLAPDGAVVARGFVGHDAAEMPGIIGRIAGRPAARAAASGGARRRSGRGAELVPAHGSRRTSTASEGGQP